ncbi:hypothetical protein [Deinococcus sp.]|uniref:hypothetical protein n=1 Tax=Deinococcus sp. TaxID=47478 RepID=UPI0025F335FB|nr:hypothetical protein [Deinococcus sp.]
MPWLNAFFLLLLAVLVGWVPVLGPLVLGFFAARSERGPRALLVMLPGLIVIGVGWAALRSLAGVVERSGLAGWLWTAVAWFLSPLSSALGRSLSQLIGDSSVQTVLLMILAPLVVGLVAGAISGRR